MNYPTGSFSLDPRPPPKDIIYLPKCSDHQSPWKLYNFLERAGIIAVAISLRNFIRTKARWHPFRSKLKRYEEAVMTRRILDSAAGLLVQSIHLKPRSKETLLPKLLVRESVARDRHWRATGHQADWRQDQTSRDSALRSSIRHKMPAARSILRMLAHDRTRLLVAWIQFVDWYDDVISAYEARFWLIFDVKYRILHKEAIWRTCGGPLRPVMRIDQWMCTKTCTWGQAQESWLRDWPQNMPRPSVDTKSALKSPVLNMGAFV